MFFLTIKLNDERQGEGGTLALIIDNITTGFYFLQGVYIRVVLIVCAPSRNRTYI